MNSLNHIISVREIQDFYHFRSGNDVLYALIQYIK
jgi:hypothetical protein